MESMNDSELPIANMSIFICDNISNFLPTKVIYKEPSTWNFSFVKGNFSEMELAEECSAALKTGCNAFQCKL